MGGVSSYFTCHVEREEEHVRQLKNILIFWPRRDTFIVFKPHLLPG